MSAQSASPHHPGRGVRKAAAHAPRRVGEALKEFRSLNSREARAAFADHWIGLWARDFDEAWPMVYELLQLVEEEKLYADPRRVGPGAAGDGESHGDASTYETFAAYFEDRVKQPFDTWAQMESTYHYAQRYAPDLLRKAFSIARDAKERVTEGTRILAQAIKDGLAINSGGGPMTSEEISNRDIITVRDGHGGTSAEYLMRRIARDRPDILNRAADGEFPSVRSAAVEAGIAPRTQTVRIDDPESIVRTLRNHMKPDAFARLVELLTKEDSDTQRPPGREDET